MLAIGSFQNVGAKPPLYHQILIVRSPKFLNCLRIVQRLEETVGGTAQKLLQNVYIRAVRENEPRTVSEKFL